MPEYLAPGVYIEETSFRPKTIEGVSTSTAGFVGPTRFGPTSGEPELITSFTDFERIYGGLDQLEFDGSSESTHNYLAHAVRAFFNEGGRRLYVSRVYTSAGSSDGRAKGAINGDGVSSAPALNVEARYPGKAGQAPVIFVLKAGDNILDTTDGVRALRGARQYDVVLITEAGGSPLDALYWLENEDNTFRLHPCEVASPDSGSFLLTDDNRNLTSARIVTVNVTVQSQGKFADPQTWEDLGFHPKHLRALTKVFAKAPNNRATELWVPLMVDTTGSGGPVGGEVAAILASQESAAEASPPGSLSLLDALADPGSSDEERLHRVNLTNGSDGVQPADNDYKGKEDAGGRKSGLFAFEDLENISIVAAPGSTADYTPSRQSIVQAIVNELLSHCERMRYRVAVADAPDKQLLSGVRAFRSRFDSKYAALYYPWITIRDPITEGEINVPPSGFVTGIYARSDVEHGVHKAPANEVVRGAIGFEMLINKAQQDVLNPIGINCFRFFPGRGYRLWGARTVSSDSEWKYVNVRRYFAYLERSIDRGTQWVVFENNSEPLWANVASTVEDFLFNEWKSSHLMGTKPEEAYFVRCDRSTMTQNDIDNGRLVCLIGIAPVKPAEFVIFRIGQWTADSNR